MACNWLAESGSEDDTEQQCNWLDMPDLVVSDDEELVFNDVIDEPWPRLSPGDKTSSPWPWRFPWPWPMAMAMAMAMGHGPWPIAMAIAIVHGPWAMAMAMGHGQGHGHGHPCHVSLTWQRPRGDAATSA